MKEKESQIIANVLAGKTECFSYFLDAYGQQVFNLIVRMVGSPEDAEELTQDAFMRAFSHLASFCGDSSFGTWMYRIAYNIALSALRKQDKQEVLSFDDRLWNSVSDQEADNLMTEEEDERLVDLQQALQKLTPDERALVALFYEEEKPVAEIAHIIGQREGNVKVKLHRVRKKLYTLMKEIAK